MIAYTVLNLRTGKNETKFFRETMNKAAIRSILEDAGCRLLATETVF